MKLTVTVEIHDSSAKLVATVPDVAKLRESFRKMGRQAEEFATTMGVPEERTPSRLRRV